MTRPPSTSPSRVTSVNPVPSPGNTSTPAWTDSNLDDPHHTRDKAQRVERMFAAIAPSYDLNNRLHSMGRDQAWRRAAVRMAEVKPTDKILDVACGTGDLCIAFAHAKPHSVLGIDFTYNMLRVAQHKTSSALGSISYQAGDAMRLPLPDACVDVVSIAFGIRNVARPEVAIREFFRVLKPTGRLIILEFSLPTNPILLAGYNFYFKQIMPRTATWIARDRSGAYKYLPRSVNTFIDRDGMQTLMRDAGLINLTVKPMTFGIAVCYCSIKPNASDETE